MLKKPSFNQHLRQYLETAHNFEVPKLKELLSKQILFNMDIRQIGPKEVGSNLLKMKTLRKRVDEPAEVIGSSETTLIELKLKAFALENYKPTSKAFFEVLYLANANKLLCEPHKIIRQKVLDYFIRLAYYMNGYMEHFVELLAEARKHKIDAKMLKIGKDKAMKEIEEASMRVDVVERRAKDAKAVLRRVVEENS
ncbi:hypothetical protein COCNU_08G011780 [Cocos nucifera]|uniref:Uncharacterized protein n=1 Tax=Cocos nucifera TaxID=13894 RepID=A0A8K0IJB5_COCNU|nr:hypothetical protein COCNU_08G011780 [Cocos nucifera]